MKMIAMRFINRNREVLKYVLEEVMEDGGEGVIVRQPHSFYVRGRSHSLWKLKVHLFILSLFSIILLFLFFINVIFFIKDTKRRHRSVGGESRRGFNLPITTV